MRREIKAPYWIKKNDYEAVAIGLKKVLNKWKICAIQYFRQNINDEWEPVNKGINLDKRFYAELANAAVKLKGRLQEKGDVYAIKKNHLEELRFGIKALGNQHYIALRSYVRESGGASTDKWLEIGEEVLIPTTHFPEFLGVVRDINLNLEFLRKEEVQKTQEAQKPNQVQKPRGRKQYFVDERGFIVSKKTWDELHA